MSISTAMPSTRSSPGVMPNELRGWCRRSDGSTRDLALALNHLAAAVRWGGADPAAAVPFYQESLALARQAGGSPAGRGGADAPGHPGPGSRRAGRGAAAPARWAPGVHRGQGRDGIPLALEQFAALAAACGQADHAVRLAGAGAAWRRRLATYPTPYAAWIGRHLAAARRMLPRAHTHAAWQAGEAMRLEQAIAYALDDDATP